MLKTLKPALDVVFDLNTGRIRIEGVWFTPCARVECDVVDFKDLGEDDQTDAKLDSRMVFDALNRLVNRERAAQEALYRVKGAAMNLDQYVGGVLR